MDASDLLQIHGGESPIDGQLNRMMHFAEVAEFAQDQNRSLLSQRFSLEPAETGSCKQCACEFIEKADKCGKKLGKSLKHCGSGKVYQEDSEEHDEVCQISCTGNRHRKVERQTLQDQNLL